MKTVICVKGAGSTGKSETIKLLHQLIISTFKPVVSMLKNGADIKTILTIGNKKVGLESQGDPNSRLETSLSEFIANNCDIIICVCRTGGMTKEWVKDTQKSGYRVIYGQNYSTWEISLRGQLNNMSAQFLLRLFDDVLNGKI